MLGALARIGFAILAALVIDAARAGLVAAEASFVPGVSPETVRDTSPGPLVIPIVVVGIAGLAIFAVLRSPRRGDLMRVVVGVLGVLFGGVFVLAGLFGDLSGNHEIKVVPLAIGLVVVGASVYAISRVTRAPARSASGDRIA